MTSSLASFSSSPNAHILLLGMGGTIAGLADDPQTEPDRYEAGRVSVEALIEQAGVSLPSGLKVLARQLANIDSRNLSELLLTRLGNEIKQSLENPAVIGIVVTHGTDTIEETGFFLHAVCGNRARELGKRVVLTGALLPANAPKADGPANISDSLRWVASTSEDSPGGIFAVFAGKVCLARDLAKRHTSTLDAPLQDSLCSPIRLIGPSWLASVREMQASAGFDLAIPAETDWPWVEILMSHAGARSDSVEQWASSGVDGLVIAGTGQGGYHQSWRAALEKAAGKGIAIVRSSRTGAGPVSLDLAQKGDFGTPSAGDLSPPKARIALQLAIHSAREAKKIAQTGANYLTWQDFFARIALLPEIR